MLIQSHRQEALSRAYIHAIAGSCGFSCSTRDFDYGIDMSLHVSMTRTIRHAPRVHSIVNQNQ